MFFFLVNAAFYTLFFILNTQRKPRNILMPVCLLFRVAVIGPFLTIDVQIGRVLKRGILQNTWPSLQAHNPLPSVGLHAGYVYGKYM